MLQDYISEAKNKPLRVTEERKEGVSIETHLIQKIEIDDF